MPNVTQPIASIVQLEKLRRQQVLYYRCVGVLEEVMSSGVSLSESSLAWRMGFTHSGRISFVLRDHPQLSRIIREYREVMSGRRLTEIRRRIWQRAKNKRKKKLPPVVLNETVIINAAASLYERGKKVGTITLARELRAEKRHILEYLRSRNELKVEIGYKLRVKKG